MHRSLSGGTRRWNTRAGWADLIAAAPRMELEQAWVRLAVAIFVLLAVIFELRGLDHAMQAAPRALWFIVGFILFATTIVLWILSVPRPSPLRRMLGIAADNSAITYAMLAMGDSGALVFGMYLFVAFGNGFRYGRLYLSLSQVLALVGFVIVLAVSDFWSKNVLVGMGLLIMLIILPFYVGALAHYTHLRHLRTEQALNECLERERQRT